VNATLRAEVEKLLASEQDPEVSAQALNDYWWFRHGQPHELTEILATTIRYFCMKGIEHALDTYGHKARDLEPFLDDEWASESLANRVPLG